MKNTMYKAAAAVVRLHIGDPQKNAEEIISVMHRCRGHALVVFPELCITGYTCADLFGQSALLAEAADALQKIAAASAGIKGLIAAVGLPVVHRNSVYNCAAFVHEGTILGIVPKSYIPNYSEFYESRWFASGRAVRGASVRIGDCEVPFGTDLLFEDPQNGLCIGTDICEDLWVPDKPSTHACLAGANTIVNLSASDEIIGKQEFRTTMVVQQSAGCYCNYLYVSAGTDESSTDLVFSGHTVIASNGRLLCDDIFPEGATIHSVILDTERCTYNRTHQNTFQTHTDGYRYILVHAAMLTGSNDITCDALMEELKNEQYAIARNPFVPADDAERERRCRRILQIQANGLATRVRATGIRNLILGISGGLDSTLALIVAYEAKKIIPDIHIISYTLPNRGNTSSLTYRNATGLMEQLSDECREVAIEDGVRRHLVDIGHGGVYKGENDTTYENAQARMRTYILMDAANMENGLVVGTGDLSELALGWCTYNGDHMSMYGVNGSVPKTLVQYICRTYAYMTDNTVLRDILLSILDTPISPELTPNTDGKIAQKTEEKIGKYDLNDFFLYYVLRYGFVPEKVLAFACTAYPELEKAFVKEAAVRFYRRFFSQQFKRSCLPDGPKVGSVTLSPRGDWRMPSDASVQMWLRALENA